MNTIVGPWNQSGYDRATNNNFDVQSSLVRIGRKLLIHLVVKSGSGLNEEKEGFVELADLDGLVAEERWAGASVGGRTPRSNEDVADLLRKMIDWKRDENGVYLPKVEPGSTILVDRPGSDTVKALDVAEQAYEKIPKKKLTVEDKSCTCPMRDLIMVGCRCGAMKAERGE